MYADTHMFEKRRDPGFQKGMLGGGRASKLPGLVGSGPQTPAPSCKPTGHGSHVSCRLCCGLVGVSMSFRVMMWDLYMALGRFFVVKQGLMYWLSLNLVSITALA